MHTFGEDYFSIQSKLKRTLATHQNLDSDNFLNGVHEQVLSFISMNSYGPLETMSLKHFETKGKMIRPMFIMELASSLNLSLSEVFNWAVACEILHNATLVHDDLQDGDEQRRGVPTSWKLYGQEQAINIGDFLLIIASQPVILGQIKNKEKLLHLFSLMSAGVVAGQVNEFEMSRLFKPQNLMNEYLHCISGKTSTLFSGLALGVALIAEESEANAQAIESIFFQLGLIFQIQDDILDIYGEKMRGEIGCDIKEGKLSFLIVTHLAKNPDDFEVIKAILKKERRLTTDEDVLIIKDLFEEKKTLQSAIVDLEQRVESLLGHSYLAENLGLKKMIQMLLDKIFAPINHIKINKMVTNFDRMPGKVLLFGEYSVLFNSQGLITPYEGFYGKLSLDGFKTQSHEILKSLANYLSEKSISYIDLIKLEKDLSEGLFFDSNIPVGQGMGSSAAVTAALIKSYGIDIDKISLSELQEKLGLIESYFHGKSSGFDPLVCCLNNTLLKTKEGTLESITLPRIEQSLRIFLVPTEESREGAKVIGHFLEKMKVESFRNHYLNDYIPLNDLCIQHFLNQSADLESHFEKLSKAQFQFFSDTMSPEVILLWNKGLEQKSFFLKQCGAGGGGFYLAFSFDPKFSPESSWIDLKFQE